MKLLIVTLAGLAAFANIQEKAFVKSFQRDPESCFPVTLQKFPVGLKSHTGLSEYEYHKVLDQFQDVMGKEVKARLNKSLIIERRWNSSEVDAFATRDDENNPVIVINGGLARHPLMTKDGLLLLTCHEVGHHLGGAPKILRGKSGLRGWSSAEGQADYYATTKCLPLFFKPENISKKLESEFDSKKIEMASAKCDDSVCTRIVLAGLDVGSFFASLVQGTPEPSLLINDQTKVDKTLYIHPNPQCRVDTYLSGAKCDAGVDEPFDSTDPRVGACIKDTGARPLCWFQEKDFF